MKIVTIVGTRPQWMKIDNEMDQVIVDVGQHWSENLRYESFAEKLKLPKPAYELKTQKFSTMVSKIISVLRKEKPTVVQVFGDCRSTLAGAVSASELGIPIVHVEAGMRSYRRDQPEERNRIIVDHLATVNFTASYEAHQNLDKEHIRENVFFAGNVMFDTFTQFCPMKKGKDHKKYVYLTLHRQENADSRVRLEDIFDALDREERIIFPAHPRILQSLKRFKIELPDNIEVIDPQPYDKNIQLISDATKVLTDSGGVQSESYFMGVPCGVLRRESEWNEYIEDGWNFLLDADPTNIELFLNTNFRFDRARPHMPLHGAKKRIRQAIAEFYG